MTPTMIDLTRGSPPTDVLPIDDMIHCCESALRQYGKVLLQYNPSPGFAPMREWLAERHGVPAAQVFMGNSSLEILEFLSRILLQSKRRVFVELPTYDRTLTQLQRAGADLVGIPMRDDGVDLDAFEAELRRGIPAFAYLIPDFQNPSSITASQAHRHQLAAWAQQHGFWIIEDAPYRPLRYMGIELPTIHSMAPQHVLHMSSLSKQLAPGVRLGYLLGSEELVNQLTNWAVDTYIGPVTLAQGAAYEYCRQGLMDKNIEKLKTIYRPRLEALLSALDEHLPQAHYPRPEGGYYVSLTLPQGICMDDLLPNAAKAGLKLSDGRGFFINPAEGERFLRIPFCSVSEDNLKRAVLTFRDIIQ